MYKAYHYDLLPHNTFGIAANAEEFIAYDSVEELQTLIADWQVSGFPQRLLHIGGGSNLLFTEDFKGTILHSQIKGIHLLHEDDDAVHICVGAGEVWDEFVEHCVQQGWYGLENLSLIPGEVGAAAVQNIGAYGVEVEAYITAVHAVALDTGKVETFSVSMLEYAYRSSIFKHAYKGKYAITAVEFALSKHFVPNLSYAALRQAFAADEAITANAIRQSVIAIRNSKIPDVKVLGSGGSFFMNPVVPRSVFERLYSTYPTMPYYDMGDTVKIPAGWLIEQCGWKGQRIGQVGVYEKQALILVNLGGCTGREVVELSRRIVADVKAKFGIDIHPEINFI